MLGRTLKNILSGLPSDTNLTREQQDIKSILEQRAKDVVWVVIAGKSGTGKSSLINYLFDPPIPLEEGVGDYGTIEPHTEELDLGEEKGRIKFTDLPGIGESLESDKSAKNLTRHYLEKCDVVLWLFKSDDNTKISEQEFFNELPKHLKDKFILGLSKIDQPVNRGFWNDKTNTPSQKIMEHILKRIDSIHKSIDIPTTKIIEFSTYKEYHVDILAKALLMSMKNKSDVLEHKLANVF